MPNHGGFPLAGEPLDCRSIVRRLAARKGFLSADNHFLPEAFIRRPTDHEGLSVFIAATCSLDRARSHLKTCYGVATLHVGRIRDADPALDVVRDSEIHADIVGMPLPTEDEARAYYLASVLAEQARTEWVP